MSETEALRQVVRDLLVALYDIHTYAGTTKAKKSWQELHGAMERAQRLLKTSP